MMSWYRGQRTFQKIRGTNGFLKMSPAGTRKKNASKGIIITKTPGFVRRISFLEPSGLLIISPKISSPLQPQWPRGQGWRWWKVEGAALPLSVPAALSSDVFLTPCFITFKLNLKSGEQGEWETVGRAVCGSKTNISQGFRQQRPLCAPKTPSHRRATADGPPSQHNTPAIPFIHTHTQTHTVTHMRPERIESTFFRACVY